MKYFLSKMNFYFPVETFNYLDIIQLLILFFVFYLIIKNMIHTRAWIIIKGLLLVLFSYLFAKIFALESISFLFEKISGLIAISIVLLFQQEIRKIFEKIGKQDVLKFIFSFKNINEKELYYSKKTISEISKAVLEMSKVKTGALIVLEKDIVLNEYVKTGIFMNSDVSWQLIVNIFEHNTPLHDGAIILSKDKILAATCYLPLSTNESIDKKMGTRHRAGIGITENSDSIVIIVSEETGSISFVYNGIIEHDITQGKLYELLYNNVQKQIEKDTKKIANKKQKISMKNIGIGISVFLSIIVWFFTINVNDEIITKTYKNIEVEIENTKVLNNTGYTYGIKSGEIIDVTISAKRSIIENFKEKDIVATADFSELSIVNSVPIKVNIANKYKESISIEEVSHTTMVLNVEDTKTIDIPLTVNLKGIEKSGFKAIVNQNKVVTIRVTGPESIIDTLDKGFCDISIDGKSENFTSIPDFILYDKNGNIIDYENKNIKLTNTDIFVNLYETKKVPIEVVSAKNTEDTKYELISYETNVNEVEIAGETEFIENLEKITIEVNSNDQLSTNWDFYLPDNIYPVNQDTNIKITSNMNIYEKKVFILSTNDIKLLNLQKNQTLNFNQNTFSFVAYVNNLINEVTNPITLEPTIDVNKIKNNKAELILRQTDGVLYGEQQHVDVFVVETKVR